MYFVCLILFGLIFNCENKEIDLNKRQDPDISRKLVQLESDVNRLREIVNGHKGLSGSTYVRWGRTSCNGNGAVTVYTGYTAGTYYDSIGASNVICLPTNPQFGNVTKVGYDIHGAEYASDMFGQNMQGQDIPCSLCETLGVTSAMIPGRTDCYPGWNLEYSGYLALGHSSSSSEFICIDKDSQAVPGGEGYTNDGRLFYPVVSKCGTLLCPPYHDRYNLACVVCSK